MQQKSQNHWEKTFEAFLSMMDFELVHYENGWGLLDFQRANLGQIESERFESPEQIVERLDTYINDYYFRDLKEEAEAYGIKIPPMRYLAKIYGDEVASRGTMYWLAVRAEQGVDSKFVTYHEHEFEVMQMLQWHLSEIDLKNIKHQEVK